MARHARNWFRRQDDAPMAGVSATTVDWRSVGLFVLLSYGLGWAAWLGLRPMFPLALRTGIAMFAPMFSAIAVVRLRRGQHLRRQWRLGWARLAENLAASLLAAAIVGAAMTAGFGLSLLSGDLKLPGSSGASLFQILPIPVAVALYWLTAFGEEYGWRGYLVPELAPWGEPRAPS